MKSKQQSFTLLIAGMLLMIAAMVAAMVAAVAVPTQAAPVNNIPTATEPAPPATATNEPTSPPATTAPTDEPTDEPPRPTTPGEATATNVPGVVPSATTTSAPPPPDDNEESGRADPAVFKSASPNQAEIGDEVLFTITATNLGTIDAEGVVVEDSIPSFLELISAESDWGQVVVNGSTVGWWLGRVSPSDEFVLTIRVRVVAAAASPGNRNTAVLTTTSRGDDPSNNRSSVAIIVPQPIITPTAVVTVTTVVTTTAEVPTAAAPTAEAPPAAAPTQAPAPTAVSPAQLPNTGSGGPGGTPLALLALGLILVIASFVVRRRTS